MSKYLCNADIYFADGTHGAAGQTVDLDPAKVPDIADLEATLYDGSPVLVKVDEPSSSKVSKYIKSTVTYQGQTEPSQEVTADE